jgi:hypothetical protein
VLYWQQAATILPRQPLLGFGIGQFGGVVAEKNDPQWHKNPKLGPEGFNRYGFQAVQIDSFWLHLVMEVGILGLVAFLVWLLAVARPLVPTRTPQSRQPRQAPPFEVVWGVAALAFTVVVAFLSPSFEDPLLPPLLWAVVGVAWWAQRRSQEAAASVFTADTAHMPVLGGRRQTEDDTDVLSTDDILTTAHRNRGPAPESDGRESTPKD